MTATLGRYTNRNMVSALAAEISIKEKILTRNVAYVQYRINL